MRTRASRENKIREASGHVVIDAVVAPQDGSGPCCSVRHQNLRLRSISLKACDISLRRVAHPLSCTRDGQRDAAGSAG